MKPVLKQALALGATFGTAYLLVADSTRKCTHELQTVMVSASGSCGLPGDLTLQSEKDNCGLSATGSPATGLPTEGQLGEKMDLRQGGWTLSGKTILAVPEGSPDGGSDGGAGRLTLSGDVTRNCTASPSANGILSLKCNDGSSAQEGACAEVLSFR